MTGHSYRSLWTYEQFSQDDCFRENIMSRYICFSRRSGVGSLGSSTKFQRDGLGTYCRNIASIASIPERNEAFAKLNSDDISYFKKVLGERGVIQDDEKLDDANTDWMRKYKGSSKLMLQPRSTQEVNVFFQLPNLNFQTNKDPFCGLWFLPFCFLIRRQSWFFLKKIFI